jgi:ArsR family transcriptional regulator
MTSEEIALVCKALGDGNRLEIVQMLSGGEMCACKLLEKFNITQPTLSHHMKILCDSGLVKIRREGKWAHYSLDCTTLAAFREFIVHLTCTPSAAAPDGECRCV